MKNRIYDRGKRFVIRRKQKGIFLEKIKVRNTIFINIFQSKMKTQFGANIAFPNAIGTNENNQWIILGSYRINRTVGLYKLYIAWQYKFFCTILRLVISDYENAI